MFNLVILLFVLTVCKTAHFSLQYFGAVRAHNEQIMYCWGKARDGALGLGGIEELFVSSPRWSKYLAGKDVRIVG